MNDVIDNKELLQPEFRLFKIIGFILGSFVQYAIYRRLGAPRWAALGVVDISNRIELPRLRTRLRAIP